MKLSDQIRAAAKRLTPETWIKGHLFWENRGVFCMCAHGAMQTECNPSVYAYIADIDYFSKNFSNKMIDYERILHSSSLIAKRNLDFWENRLRPCWENRPDWVRKTDPERGNLEAHYLLGMVGLTAGFNDHPDTTLEQVLEKFEQAAKLAESLNL